MEWLLAFHAAGPSQITSASSSVPAAHVAFRPGMTPTLDRSTGVVGRGFKVALVLVFAARIWNALIYDPRWQHGAKIHLGYLRDLTQEHLPASYNAPWVYLLTLVLSA